MFISGPRCLPLRILGRTCRLFRNRNRGYFEATRRRLQQPSHQSVHVQNQPPFSLHRTPPKGSRALQQARISVPETNHPPRRLRPAVRPKTTQNPSKAARRNARSDDPPGFVLGWRCRTGHLERLPPAHRARPSLAVLPLLEDHQRPVPGIFHPTEGCFRAAVAAQHVRLYATADAAKSSRRISWNGELQTLDRS